MALPLSEGEKLRVLGKLRYYEKLLKEGKTDVADTYARAHRVGPYESTEVPSAVATPMINPVPPAPDTTETVPEIPENSTHWNGWPKQTLAKVVKRCLNPRLVVIELANGKRSLMYNNGPRAWAMGAKIGVELHDKKGEPVYKAMRGLQPITFFEGTAVEKAAVMEL